MNELRNGAYVYIWLGGDYLRAGFWICEEDGKFATNSKFQYDETYFLRSDAIPLDPASLPLLEGRKITSSDSGRPLFGVFHDRLPDRWGQRVFNEIAAERGLPEPSCFDRIVAGSKSAIGALAFGPRNSALPKWDYPLHMDGRNLADCDLETLMLAAELFEVNGFDGMPAIFKSYLGTSVQSVGGARPKSLLEIKGVPVLAKFKVRGDEWNVCAIENATMKFAAGMGIRVPGTSLRQIKGRDIFIIERFDRNAQGPVHLATAASLLRANYANMASALENHSYLEIVEAIGAFGSPGFVPSDREELFRRVIYNILFNNEDDHLKNHSFIFDGEGWRLSPLYDVVPCENAVRHLRLAVSEEQKTLMTLSNALLAHAVFGLDRKQAERIVEEMTDRFFTSWKTFFKAHGVEKKDMDMLSSRIGPLNERRLTLETDPWVTGPLLGKVHAVKGLHEDEATNEETAGPRI